jgi:hypothetical protein
MLDVDRTVALLRPSSSVETLLADPLGFVAADHRARRALADLLESLADQLPDDADETAAARAAALLRGPLARDAALEDEALFPVYAARVADPSAGRCVEIARREQREIAGRAIELADELDRLAEGGRARNPESLGFMLRAFFDGLRRQEDWVEAAIMSQARSALTPTDLAALGARLAALAARGALPDWSALVPAGD